MEGRDLACGIDDVPPLLYDVGPEGAGVRLDVFLAGENHTWTRSFVANQIAAGRVAVNGRSASKAGAKLKAGDTVEVECPPIAATELVAEDIPIRFVYQDADIAVIDKPQGMVVHPAPGHVRGTLVNALLYHVEDLAGIGGEMRPGIVHRIDKDTTGLLVVAKNDFAHRSLCDQIASKTAKRLYWAIVENNVKEDAGSVDAPIARSRRDRKKMAVAPEGRPALTHYRVLERFGAFTWLECALETGRTHQIRVHMAHIGKPVAGDPVYGSAKNPLGVQGGQALHAVALTLAHPRSGEVMRFAAPPHAHFLDALKRLGASDWRTRFDEMSP